MIDINGFPYTALPYIGVAKVIKRARLIQQPSGIAGQGLADVFKQRDRSRAVAEPLENGREVDRGTPSEGGCRIRSRGNPQGSFELGSGPIQKLCPIQPRRGCRQFQAPFMVIVGGGLSLARRRGEILLLRLEVIPNLP